MQHPVQITFRDIEKSPALAGDIREKADKLETFNERITSCRVVVERASRKRHTGNMFHVRVDLTLPGGELVAAKTHARKGGAHKDPYVAVRDAFEVAERQLLEFTRRRRTRVHLRDQAVSPHGRVLRLLYEEGGGYGFIEATDGREIYFNSHSVLKDHFPDLKVGTEVRFAEEEGEEGPQASTVEVVGRG